jgi:hypothetical protein
MALTIEGVSVPDSKLAREVTELVRDTESPLLLHHSSRVYYSGAFAGKHRGLTLEPELLYIGAVFHDIGLTQKYRSSHERFEVDGANAARDFLRNHGISQQEIDTVWVAIALHTTPGTLQHLHPVVALVTAGVEMDVLGLTHPDYSPAERKAVVLVHPRPLSPRKKSSGRSTTASGTSQAPRSVMCRPPSTGPARLTLEHTLAPRS